MPEGAIRPIPPLASAVLTAALAAVESVNPLLYGSYAFEGACTGATLVLIGPWGVNLRTAGGGRLFWTWETCAT